MTQAQWIAEEEIEALFLMTTADYDQDQFLSIGKAVKAVLPDSVQLVANTSDFDLEYAKKLKQTGFTGAYHIVRLREGTDTEIPKETRIHTLNAIKAAGLDLYYCVEPIGAEHTYDEIADEMIRARDYNVDVMAIMGRVGVQGTQYENTQPLSELELTKIAAVTRIVTNPQKSMCIHEPQTMPLLAGVNQFYAEFGGNPRDTESSTENHRGFGISEIKRLLCDAGYHI